MTLLSTVEATGVFYSGLHLEWLGSLEHSDSQCLEFEKDWGVESSATER
jgi:hypothetical protein